MIPSSRLTALLVLALLTATAAAAKETYVYNLKWGTQGSADGQFQEAMGLHARGTSLVVADKGNNRIQVFNLDGGFVSKYGTSGSGNDQLTTPTDALFDLTMRVYVLDSNGRVVKRSAALGYLSQWGTAGSGAEQFSGAMGLGIDDANSVLYAADRLNNRISKWTLGGVHLLNFGAAGSATGQLNQPGGVAVDASGYVYVADTGNSRIQKFTSAGAYLTSWDGSSSGGTLQLPYSLTAAGGYIFVADTFNSLIKKYTQSGTFVCSFGGYGTGNGKLNHPAAVAVDAQGRVFVSDMSNSRVQRFVRDLLPTPPATVAFSPKPPHDNDNLVAKAAGATDGDDPSLTYRYKWYYSPDGSEWHAGPTKRVLPAASTSVGQYWKVSARAYDGKAFGPWKTSYAMRIAAGAAPALTAQAQQQQGRVAVTVQLSCPAQLEVGLRNLAGRPVTQVWSRAAQAGTTRSLLSLQRPGGGAVPAGHYLLSVTARTPAGEILRQLIALVVGG